MKYYSEVLDKFFDVEDELRAAESNSKAEDRKHRHTKHHVEKSQNFENSKEVAVEAEVERPVEKLVEKLVEKKEVTPEEEKAAISRCKKALAAEIEKLAEKVSEKSGALDQARTEAKAIMEKAAAEADAKVDAAQKEVREAELERFNKIVEFNKRFGRYSVVYTGEQALKELEKRSAEIRNAFPMFNPWRFF